MTSPHSSASAAPPAKMAGPWYSIRSLSPMAAAARGVQSAAKVFIYGDIGESWFGESVTAAQFVKDLSAVDAAHLTVRINSFGGSVPDGITIHNALKRHPATVTTAVDGLAASIASLIAMAGDTVQIAENAMLMIHAPWGGIVGNAAALRDRADMLDTWAEAMATSYVAKTGKPLDDMLAILKDGADHWYTAAQALEEGFADEVVAASPESTGAMAAFDLTRYRTVPAALASAVAQRTPAAAAALPVAPATDPLENAMTQVTTPAASATNTATAGAAPLDEAAIRAAAIAGESQRRADIRAAFAPFAGRAGVAELQAKLEADTQASAAIAGQQLLAHLARDVTPVAGGHIVTVEDESDKRRNAIVNALLVRAAVAPADVRAANNGNPFRGHTLLDIARASLQSAGIRTEGMDKMQLVAAAFTQGTSDFPVLLENTMHKTLQGAYALAPDTWSRFCARGSVSDFRAHNRYRVGSLGNLDSKSELNEFKSKAIPDGEKASITASTKGNIINLSREAIINDDLGAFVGLAAMLGRAAKRTVEADVYTTLALNSGLGPTLSDGKTLFHADHGNITTGAALAAGAIDLDRVAMGSQRDVSGNDYLDLTPAVLLVPLSLGSTARTINSAEYDPDTVANKAQMKPNSVRGLFRDVVDTARLTGTRRYLFADANIAPVLEVAFLDGNDTPYLEMEQGFTVDGARWKVRLDFGIAGVDYRGAVTNAGA
jgi:ATP-dependent protease ClpP protease subunit